MAAIQNFILIFDHSNDTLVEQLEYGADLERATEDYSQFEHQYADNSAIDVVLVGSDSIETVRKTHANYFEGNTRRLIENAFSLFS